MYTNNKMIDAFTGDNVKQLPLWMMRQAGRYLPEYREIRQNAGSFIDLCKNPELACKVTLQPINRFNLDAAIIFSDILVIPDAMGLGLYFTEGEGPKFKNPINTIADIDNIPDLDIEFSLKYVIDAIKYTKQELNNNIPLIGFSGSPFTLACYMIEGSSSKNYLKVKEWLYQNPIYTHKLLTKLAVVIIEYLNAQIRAGADIIMIFDSWGGILSDIAYQQFSLKYIDQILQGLIKNHNGKQIQNIVFTKSGGIWLNKIKSINPDAIGLDWTVNVGEARKLVGSNIALQGNIDPIIMSVGNQQIIQTEVQNIITSYYKANNNSLNKYIFNLGHGILPSAKIDNVHYLIDAIKVTCENIEKII